MRPSDPIHSGQTDVPAARPPWAGIVVYVLCLLAMVAVSWMLWDSLPDVVVTREATAERAGVQVPRFVIVAAVPVTLLIVGAVMTSTLMAGGRLRRRVDPALVVRPQSQTKAMNVVFVVLPLFLLALHSGLLLRAAGHEVPLDRAMAVGIGLLLIALGNVLPKIGPSRVPEGSSERVVLAWQRAQRPGGLAMMLLGVACVVAAFFLPPLVVAVSAVMLVAAVYVLMGVLTGQRLR
ncbi:hypothetical protein AB0O28_02000 [Microbispora sp. NPDC088329]|uniref:hypothetical protein n=1 Tax=Microbispora sp. NPDC088329 TaxID=3154869 RepID=UPI00342B609C